MTDQQRHDWVGARGRDLGIETPHLDRLAAAGTTFERAYSGSTVCVPARTALLTGLQPHRVPKEGDSHAIRQGTWTVARALRAGGYQTALVGRMHFTPMHADHGFDHVRLCENVSAGSGYAETDVDHYAAWLADQGLADPRRELRQPDGSTVPVLAGLVHRFPYDAELHPTSWIVREALDLLRRRDPDRPLFLVVSFPHPHGPFDPPAPYDTLVDPQDIVLPTDGFEVNDGLPAGWRALLEQGQRFRADGPHADRTRRVLAAVAGLVRHIDDGLGQLLDAVDLARSVVWFTSDHGDFGGHRGLYNKVPWIPFEDLVRVPLVVAGSGVRAGAAIATPVQVQDFTLTCLDHAGISPPRANFGSASLRPLLEGANPAARDVLTGFGTWYPTIVRGNHKLIAYDAETQLLVDLAADPGERRSCLDDPALADLVDDLRQMLIRTLARPAPDLPVDVVG